MSSRLNTITFSVSTLTFSELGYEGMIFSYLVMIFFINSKFILSSCVNNGFVAEPISVSTPQMNLSLMRASSDNQRQ